jgi:hypothetical protein
MHVVGQHCEAATDLFSVARKVLVACEPFGPLQALQLIHDMPSHSRLRNQVGRRSSNSLKREN